MSECSVDDCEKSVFRNGLCAMHNQRMKRHGDVNYTNPNGFKSRYPKSYVPGYARAHMRLGSASVHTCPCGVQAQDWSYRGGDPEALTQESGKYAGLVYSLNPDYYEALCEKCHGQRDLAGDANPAAKLTEEQAVAIVAEYATGSVTQKALADRYGITQGHVSDLVNGKRRAIVAVLAADTRKGVASRDEVQARR